MKLFVVGHLYPGEEKSWEIVGVYDDEAKAVAACLNACYFIGPLNLNDTAPTETTEWPGSYIPALAEV